MTFSATIIAHLISSDSSPVVLASVWSNAHFLYNFELSVTFPAEIQQLNTPSYTVNNNYISSALTSLIKLITLWHHFC